jgi:methanogenic corrinoid protein MtbC1
MPFEAAWSAQDAFLEALLETDRQAARQVLESARQLDTPAAVLETLVRPVLERIGNRWETGELALSQVYMSGRICEELIDTLQPDQGGHCAGSEPRVAIGVIEDHHALGKRVVLSFLRAAGVKVRDYGCGLSVDELVVRSRADRTLVLLVSALMLRSAMRIKDLVAALRNAELPVKVVAGGAPFVFDRRLAEAVGADAVGYNASDALAIVRRLLGGES